MYGLPSFKIGFFCFMGLATERGVPSWLTRPPAALMTSEKVALIFFGAPGTTRRGWGRAIEVYVS